MMKGKIIEFLIFFKILFSNGMERHFLKAAFSTVFLSIALYIFIPTVDEILIHSVFGLFLWTIFTVSLAHGLLMSLLAHRGLGIALLFIALFVGGKPIYSKLK